MHIDEVWLVLRYQHDGGGREQCKVFARNSAMGEMLLGLALAT